MASGLRFGTEELKGVEVMRDDSRLGGALPYGEEREKGAQKTSKRCS